MKKSQVRENFTPNTISSKGHHGWAHRARNIFNFTDVAWWKYQCQLKYQSKEKPLKQTVIKYLLVNAKNIWKEFPFSHLSFIARSIFVTLTAQNMWLVL